MADRRIVVIGGANGIGAATARAADAAGARVIVADVRDASWLADHPSIAEHRTDVTNPSSLAALRDRAIASFGHVDAVVNCAATIAPGSLSGTSLGAVRAQLDVNLLGTVLTTRAFLPAFLERRAGHFIHLASLGGIVPMPHEAVYSATKFAVRGFALAMAEELRGTGVHVTVVCPDSTATSQLASEARDGGSPLSFLSRPLPADAVARAILGALSRPSREVCVPGRRALAAKLAGASPTLFRLAYPVLDALGSRARGRYTTAIPSNRTTDREVTDERVSA